MSGNTTTRKKAGTAARKPATARPGGKRPIMALLELLSRRWAMRALWELRDGRLTFRALQEACDAVSPTVLNDRLRELREARLVDLAEGEGFGLSPLGRELLERFSPMVSWAERWAKASAK